ncbi:MAG: TnpV protein [Clostridia bacterium]|nr:TnpV protein [Clostridia bacterium]
MDVQRRFCIKSLFEQFGDTYTQQDDYFLPDLKLPPEEERPVGVWGQRRLRYLKEHRPILYTNLKTSGQLRSHLADVEEQANALFLRLVKDYAASEGVTEQLKVEEPMEWVRRMNGIKLEAVEVVNLEVIFT